jgi:hypothetical protein
VAYLESTVSQGHKEKKLMFRKVLVVLGLVVVLSVGMLQFTLARSGDDLTEQNTLIVQQVITDL